jgi:virginiamycin A acetyltransferase
MYSYGVFYSDLSSVTVIGRYTSVGQNFLVLDGSHPLTHKSTHPFFFNPDFRYVSTLGIKRRAKLTIGNDVYIGANVVLLPAVESIGNGAVIGAGSVVTKDVPPFAIVGGNPAKLIRYRFGQNAIDKITNSAWWEKDIEELRNDEQKFASFLHPLE